MIPDAIQRLHILQGLDDFFSWKGSQKDKYEKKMKYFDIDNTVSLDDLIEVQNFASFNRRLVLDVILISNKYELTPDRSRVHCEHLNEALINAYSRMPQSETNTKQSKLISLIDKKNSTEAIRHILPLACRLYSKIHVNSILEEIKNIDGHPDDTLLTTTVSQLYAHFSIVESIVSTFPDLVKKMDKDGNLPIHLLCRFGDPVNLEVLRLLFQLYPLSLNVPNKENMYPIHFAYKRLDRATFTFIWNRTHNFYKNQIRKLWSNEFYHLDSEKNNYLHLAIIRSDKEENILNLIDFKPDLVWGINSSSLIPLNMALHCSCSRNILRKLLLVMQEQACEYNSMKGYKDKNSMAHSKGVDYSIDSDDKSHLRLSPSRSSRGMSTIFYL
jgi:hypothetical protein